MLKIEFNLSSGAVALAAAGFLSVSASGGIVPPAPVNPPVQAEQHLECGTASSAPREDDVDRIIGPFSSSITSLSPANVRMATDLLAALRSILAQIPKAAGELPALEPVWCEDGSLLVEWPLPDRRIGFSFEQDPAQSSWFYVSLPPSLRDGSGFLSQISPVSLVLRSLVRHEP